MFIYSKTIALGLDIGSRSIKLAEIKCGKNLRGRPFKIISALSEAFLTGHEIVNGEIKNPPLVLEALKKCVKNVKGHFLKTTAVVASLPESQCYYKIINLPQKQAEDMDSFIQKTMLKHFPIENHDAYFDWQRVGKNSVAIGAAAKNIVDSYTGVIEQANLIPLSLELESTAIARALLDPNLKTNALFIDLGGSHSTIIAIQNNIPAFTLSIPLSGENMTKEIAKRQKVTIEEAEKLKLSCGAGNETKCSPKIQKIIDLLIDESMQEIQNGIQYTNKFLKYKPSKIYICGGISLMPKLTTKLSNKLKIKVRHADPLTNVKLGKAIKMPSEKLAKFTTAIGLAMRGVESDVLDLT